MAAGSLTPIVTTVSISQKLPFYPGRHVKRLPHQRLLFWNQCSKSAAFRKEKIDPTELTLTTRCTEKQNWKSPCRKPNWFWPRPHTENPPDKLVTTKSIPEAVWKRFPQTSLDTSELVIKSNILNTIQNSNRPGSTHKLNAELQIYAPKEIFHLNHS